MRVTLILLLLLSLNANGQQLPKTGKVVDDQNFKCDEYSILLWAPGYIDSVLTDYGLKNISLSENDIEIRFATFYAPSTRFELAILSFNVGSGWKGKKYELNFDTVYADLATNAERKKIVEHELKAEQLDNLFASLVKNDVFELPDQTEVRTKLNWPKDGLLHSLTFKVQNKYRTYRLENTDYFVENSRKKFFRKYHAIFTLFATQP